MKKRTRGKILEIKMPFECRKKNIQEKYDSWKISDRDVFFQIKEEYIREIWNRNAFRVKKRISNEKNTMANEKYQIEMPFECEKMQEKNTIAKKISNRNASQIEKNT